MAVPASGNAITLGKIYQEIDGAGYVAHDGSEEVSLEDMSTGNAPDTLNTNSTSRPDGSPPHAMSEFFSYNHSATPPFSWDAAAVSIPQQWGNISGTSAFTANAICTIGFAYQPADNRMRVRQGNGNNSTALSYSYHNTTYTGTDPANLQAQVTWSGSFSGSYQSSSEGSGRTSGAFVTVAKQTTSSNSGSFTDYTWFVQKSSGTGTASYSTNFGTNPSWSFRAIDSGGSTIATTGSSTANNISLSATRGSSGGFPGGGGGGEFFCLHEDMLVNTEFGPMSIKEVVDKDPKIWSYNFDKKQKELVDQNSNVQVQHSNLYIINNEFKITEDHVMYGENHEQYSIEPDLALKKYGKHSQELKIGDKLSTLSGDKYIVNTIEKYDGEHMTYTISTQYNNFYANDILVDSEI